MKRKKLTALLLTAAMTASVLVGCGGGDAGESTETTGSPETEGGRMKRQEHPKTVKRLSTLRCLSPCPVLRSTTATRFRKLSHRRPA